MRCNVMIPMLWLLVVLNSLVLQETLGFATPPPNARRVLPRRHTSASHGSKTNRIQAEGRSITLWSVSPEKTDITSGYRNRTVSSVSTVNTSSSSLSSTPPNANDSILVSTRTESGEKTVQIISDEDDDIDEEIEAEEDKTYRVAVRNTILSIAVSILFGAGLWVTEGPVVGQEFFAGYIVEKSLSVDNLFVFLLLFDYFQVPLQYQNRVLNWGIYGSVVMRSIMIGLGAAALQNFRGILLVFAGILIYSAVQVLIDVEQEDRLDKLDSNPVIKLSRYICNSNESCDIDEFDDSVGKQPEIVLFSRSLFPSTSEYDGDRFFTMEGGVKKATPLFMCMVAVELSDVVFAVDSIPAVFGVTENPLVVFSSNMFAILGLRSLYPVLSKAATDLKYLEPAVAIILAFIGGKMIAEYFEYIIPTEQALAVIIAILGIGVGASVWEKQRKDGNTA